LDGTASGLGEERGRPVVEERPPAEGKGGGSLRVAASKSRQKVNMFWNSRSCRIGNTKRTSVSTSSYIRGSQQTRERFARLRKDRGKVRTNLHVVWESNDEDRANLLLDLATTSTSSLLQPFQSSPTVHSSKTSREPPTSSQQRVHSTHSDGKSEGVRHRDRNERLRRKLLLLLLEMLRRRLRLLLT